MRLYRSVAAVHWQYATGELCEECDHECTKRDPVARVEAWGVRACGDGSLGPLVTWLTATIYANCACATDMGMDGRTGSDPALMVVMRTRPGRCVWRVPSVNGGSRESRQNHSRPCRAVRSTHLFSCPRGERTHRATRTRTSAPRAVGESPRTGARFRGRRSRCVSRKTQRISISFYSLLVQTRCWCWFVYCYSVSSSNNRHVLHMPNNAIKVTFSRGRRFYVSSKHVRA